MIRVVAQPEYPQFDAQVRQPGREFLLECPQPNSKDFSKNSFWTRARGELHEAYNKTCAYTCIYLIDPASVDHFIPKSVFPEMAFEWSNFRLARGKFNTSKASNLEVVDPFEIQNGWFVIDFPSCLVRASTTVSPVHRNRIKQTIEVLRLNKDDDLVQERCDIALAYASGDVTINFLRKRYPFVAAEIDRQGIHDQLSAMFSLNAN